MPVGDPHSVGILFLEAFNIALQRQKHHLRPANTGIYLLQLLLQGTDQFLPVADLGPYSNVLLKGCFLILFGIVEGRFGGLYFLQQALPLTLQLFPVLPAKEHRKAKQYQGE